MNEYNAESNENDSIITKTISARKAIQNDEIIQSSTSVSKKRYKEKDIKGTYISAAQTRKRCKSIDWYFTA